MLRFISLWFSALALGLCAPVIQGNNSTENGPNGATVLGIHDSRFTLNARPTFLLGISYYGALGAPEDFIRRDLEDMKAHGFNWLRVWATWAAFDEDVSAVDAQGGPRQPYLRKLEWLVAECDRRGLVVDVTLTRNASRRGSGGGLPNFESHQRAVETLIKALQPRRNWYLDLANERDVHDARYVSALELQALRALARKLEPELLVTASFGGHDLTASDIHDALITAGLDFLAPHRPRTAESAMQTEAQTRTALRLAKAAGRLVPVHYQEPFRRGYQTWQPTASDFMSDLRGAIAGDAAGWCFHNGAERASPEHQARRSFDLRARRLFDQLDSDERQLLALLSRMPPPAVAFAGTQAGAERSVGGVRLCWCPAGRFTMGSPRTEPERRPDEDQVEVTLTKGFWMGKYELTQGDWKRVMRQLPGPLTAELPEGDKYPLGNVNFAEAESFCSRLTEAARAAGELPAGWEFRLPTEAQWEYACRAGTTTATAFGDKLSSKQANFKGKPYNGAETGPSRGRAALVASYPANAWGLHDMHGNTFEWCRDWYQEKLPGGVDPDLHDLASPGTSKGNHHTSRVRRGGCWADEGWPCRSASRLRFEPERRYDHIGFRVVLVQQ